MTLLSLRNFLYDVRLDFLANIKVEFDANQEWKMRHVRILFDPFLVQVDLYILGVLRLADHGPLIVFFHSLPVEGPHIGPGESLL